MDTIRFIAPYSILSYDLCIESQVIVTHYALTMKQTTKNDFQKKLYIQK